MHDRSWSPCAEDGYDALAIACSAGGLRALGQILGSLPAAFPAPIFIALHRGDAPSDDLVALLRKSTLLEVRQAREGELPQAGTVYVAPGGRHLEVTPDGSLSVQRCGRIRFVCPSADLLLHSVAERYGSRALALILTGGGSDGAAGAQAVRCAGGFVLAQDPRSAEFPGMPASAVETRKVDLVLPLRQIGYALGRLAVPA